MRSLPNRTQSDSQSDISDDDFCFENSNGWNEQTELGRYLQNRDQKRVTQQLIHRANRAKSLISVLNQYKINWTISENPSGWTHKACCPFTDHKDSTPSFGYNSKDDRFYCFGCRRSGNTVQFISFMEKRSFLEVAQDILCRYQSPAEVIVELDDSSEEETDKLLLDFSAEIRKFLQRYSVSNKAQAYVEALTWNLDIYLETHLLSGTIDIISLRARLDKLIEYLSLFKDVSE